jgi:hypothetical protein
VIEISWIKFRVKKVISSHDVDFSRVHQALDGASISRGLEVKFDLEQVN